MKPAETAARLVRYGLIPVIRYANADDGALAIECALRAGIPTVEVTLTTGPYMSTRYALAIGC